MLSECEENHTTMFKELGLVDSLEAIVKTVG